MNLEYQRILKGLAGDEKHARDHFDELYDQTFGAIYRVSIKWLRDDAHASQVVTNVFNEIWEKRNELVRIPDFEQYLDDLVVRHLLDMLERR